MGFCADLAKVIFPDVAGTSPAALENMGTSASFVCLAM